MDLIVTGRIFNGNELIGYRVWSIDKYGKLRCNLLEKEKVYTLAKSCSIKNCVIKNNGIRSNTGIQISSFPRYNKQNVVTKIVGYTESDIIANALNINVENVRVNICGALIGGAITDPYSDRANRHAENYYEEIRHMSTDVARIAKNIDRTEKEIARVKNYLFMELHYLDGGYKKFDANFEIAQSWQRLMSKNKEYILPHDLTLINHELLEISLVDGGLSQEEAHEYAQATYNYRKESDEYYDKIRKHNKKG